jgi:hypothetical protein
MGLFIRQTRDWMPEPSGRCSPSRQAEYFSDAETTVVPWDQLSSVTSVVEARCAPMISRAVSVTVLRIFWIDVAELIDIEAAVSL